MPAEPTPKYVKLLPKSAFEARILATLLEDAGVKIVVSQDLRTDEFAMAQRLMNAAGAEIMVPQDQLEMAKRVIAEAREDKKFPPELLGEASAAEG